MVKGAIDLYNTADLHSYSKVIGPRSAKDLSLISSDSVEIVVTSPPYPFTTDYTKMFRLSFYWLGWDVDTWKRDEIGARWKRGQKEAVQVYFDEMELCFKEIFRVLRKGAYCCVVIGDSKRRKERVQVIDMLSRIGNTIASAKFCKKIAREISGSSLPFQSVLTENILVFKKA
jgi:DNA modification methylase